MGQGDHAIHVGVVDQGLRVDVAAKVIGDGLGHRRRAVHRRQDAHVVTGSDAAIRAHDAHKGVLVGRMNPPRIHTKGVVARKIPHGQVVHMHVFTGLDRLAGEANDLSITA